MGIAQFSFRFAEVDIMKGISQKGLLRIQHNLLCGLDGVTNRQKSVQSIDFYQKSHYIPRQFHRLAGLP